MSRRIGATEAPRNADRVLGVHSQTAPMAHSAAAATSCLGSDDTEAFLNSASLAQVSCLECLFRYACLSYYQSDPDLRGDSATDDRVASLDYLGPGENLPGKSLFLSGGAEGRGEGFGNPSVSAASTSKR